MKTSIILFFSFLSFIYLPQTREINEQSNFILIQHIGIIDKPIPTILISYEKLCKQSYKINTYRTNKKDYLHIKKLIYSYKNNNYTENEFGSFRITIFKNKQKEIDATLNKNNAILFFDCMIRSLGHDSRNSDLLSQLKKTIERIKY